MGLRPVDLKALVKQPRNVAQMEGAITTLEIEYPNPKPNPSPRPSPSPSPNPKQVLLRSSRWATSSCACAHSR